MAGRDESKQGEVTERKRWRTGYVFWSNEKRSERKKLYKTREGGRDELRACGGHCTALLMQDAWKAENKTSYKLKSCRQCSFTFQPKRRVWRSCNRETCSLARLSNSSPSFHPIIELCFSLFWSEDKRNYNISSAQVEYLGRSQIYTWSRTCSHLPSTFVCYYTIFFSCII